MEEVFLQGGLVSTEEVLHWREQVAASQNPPLSLALLSSALLSGPSSTEQSSLSQLHHRQGIRATRDLAGIWGLGMINVSLSLTHHRLCQPAASEQLDANQLSVISDLSWSLARRGAPHPQAPAGVQHYGVLPAGPADPSGTLAGSSSHL